MTNREDSVLRADADHEGADTDPDAEAVPAGDDPATPSGSGCRTQLRGWAGAHSHGAVRPRRKAAGRGRPPGRWC